jgi:hypothetical protein
MLEYGLRFLAGGIAVSAFAALGDNLDEAKPDDFDALHLPGGVINPDALRIQPPGQPRPPKRKSTTPNDTRCLS